MKIKISMFLLKEEKRIDDALSPEHELPPHPLEIDETHCVFYWKSSNPRPKWVELIDESGQVDTSELRGKSLQGLLVFERRNRTCCFTFGHARHLIDKLSIERYFGLRTALSLTDPSLIKSIDKSNIDKLPIRSRTQSSKNISISEFEFKFDAEILKSLTGIVEHADDEDAEIVSGSDSVSLHTEVSLQALPQIADRLLDAYESEDCRNKFPWIDYIIPERDITKINRLDALLVDTINGGNGDIWLAPPKTMDYENFSGFSYRRHSRGHNGQAVHLELNLTQFLADKGLTGNLLHDRLKKEKIHLYDANDSLLEDWTLHECLNGELELDGETFLLSEGDWYKIDRDYMAGICSYFDTFRRSDLALPNYAGRHEGPYLRDIADNRTIFLMDQKNVHLTGASSPIEFCDLITNEHHIIHVKKYSSSSVLSHLFSQAYVSAETLINNHEVTDQVNAYLSEETDHRFTFNSNIQPRESKIIFAIMQERPGELHMPFFSKVNFRQYSQRLTSMGFTVELLKISM